MNTPVAKLDSNVTGLRITEEKSIGVLPVANAQTWYPFEPNSYTDFGAPTKTVQRMPINPSRQVRKGTLTDLDPAAGFQNDLTQDGLTRLLQGTFFANLREDFDTRPYNGVQGTVAAVVHSSHKYELSAVPASFAIVAGDLFFASGMKAANIGLKVVASVSLVAADGVLTSTANYSDGETVTIKGRVYTIQAALTAGDGHVHLGGTEAATITNLTNAINGSGGVPGTDYNVTAPDPTVTAVGATHTVTVTAILKGYGPNSYATTTTAADASWGGADLVGGVGDIVVTDTNIVDETPAAGARMERVGHQFASADVTITNDGTDLPTFTSAAVTMTTLPVIPGEWLWIGGDSAGTDFADDVNNGWARIRSISATAFTFDKTSNEMVTDAGTSKTIQIFWGKVLKNEADPSLQVRRTYAMERSLGNPDLDNPTKPQAEYVHGAVSNETTFNMSTAEKIAIDFTYLGTDYDTIDSTGTILSQVGGASAPAVVEEDAYNTTSHVVRAKMTILSNSDSAPLALFAEVTELKFTIKNNLKANKALGKLGPFEITAGFFQGDGSVQAYFSETAAVQAVRDNADASIDFALANANAGLLFDLPLLTVQTKGLDIKINEPIMLPIDMNLSPDRNFNHTMFMQWFDYLPTLAMPA